MLILLGLVVLWAAVLLPPVVRRSRRSTVPRPIAALSASNHLDAQGLRLIRRVTTTMPADPGSARRRRRDVFVALSGVVVFTFLGGVAVGGPVWTIHFLVDLVFVGYAFLVTNRHQQVTELDQTVVPLRSSDSMLSADGIRMNDEAVLRRQAN